MIESVKLRGVPQDTKIQTVVELGPAILSDRTDDPRLIDLGVRDDEEGGIEKWATIEVADLLDALAALKATGAVRTPGPRSVRSDLTSSIQFKRDARERGWEFVGHLFALLFALVEEAPDGQLNDLTAEDLAMLGGWKGKPADFERALIESSWMIITQDGARVLGDVFES